MAMEMTAEAGWAAMLVPLFVYRPRAGSCMPRKGGVRVEQGEGIYLRNGWLSNVIVAALLHTIKTIP